SSRATPTFDPSQSSHRPLIGPAHEGDIIAKWRRSSGDDLSQPHSRGADHHRRGAAGVPSMSLVPGSAVVTGGGSGIGRAIALALAAAGTPVAVVDLLPDGGKAVAEEIRGRGKAAFISADVSV